MLHTNRSRDFQACLNPFLLCSPPSLSPLLPPPPADFTSRPSSVWGLVNFR